LRFLGVLAGRVAGRGSVGDDKAPERFATKRRVRLGLGYRLNYTWRFEVLAMRDEARATLEDEIEVDAYMLDLRLKWFL